MSTQIMDGAIDRQKEASPPRGGNNASLEAVSSFSSSGTKPSGEKSTDHLSFDNTTSLFHDSSMPAGLQNIGMDFARLSGSLDSSQAALAQYTSDSAHQTAAVPNTSDSTHSPNTDSAPSSHADNRTTIHAGADTITIDGPAKTTVQVHGDETIITIDNTGAGAGGAAHSGCHHDGSQHQGGAGAGDSAGQHSGTSGGGTSDTTAGNNSGSGTSDTTAGNNSGGGTSDTTAGNNSGGGTSDTTAGNNSGSGTSDTTAGNTGGTTAGDSTAGNTGGTTAGDTTAGKTGGTTAGDTTAGKTGGTTGTTPDVAPGNGFVINNGQLTMDGKRLSGVAVTGEYAQQVGAQQLAAELTSKFPGLNTVRLSTSPEGGAFTEGSQLSGGETLDNINQVIQELNKKGIGVIIDNHGADANTQNNVSQNGAEAAWFAEIAKANMGNNMVMYQPENEPMGSDAAIVQEQKATYDAIRATGSNAVVAFDLVGGGGSSAILSSPDTYNQMSNYVIDAHFYAAGSSDPASALTSEISQFSALHEANGGAVPVYIGETGDSIDGSNVDGAASQALSSVWNGTGNNSGGIAWLYDGAATGFNGADHLTNSDGSLTSFGQEIAGLIQKGSA